MTYRWKVRIQALALLCLLGIPGNLVTLVLYHTKQGKLFDQTLKKYLIPLKQTILN